VSKKTKKKKKNERFLLPVVFQEQQWMIVELQYDNKSSFATIEKARFENMRRERWKNMSE
jgi:hypothetical protein